VARGHTVMIWSSQWRGGPIRSRIAGIEVERSPGYFASHVLLPFRLARGERRGAIMIDDLAHVVPWPTSAVTAPNGVAFFRHLHARTLPGQVSPPARAFLSAIERSYPLLYHERTFVTESASSKSDLVGLGIRPSNILQIPPGVDSSLFCPLTKTAQPQIVYFSGLRRSKRPDHVVRVFAEIRRQFSTATLVIAGDGPARSETQALSNQLGLSEVIEFPGRLTPERLARVVGQSWVNLQTSVAEGWGYTALEASAAGTPTVGYSVPGVSESISNGRSGILVPAGSIPAMIDATSGILSRGPDQWSDSCRAWAREFSWDTATDSWETLLKALG